jgi:hypothetical protein
MTGEGVAADIAADRMLEIGVGGLLDEPLESGRAPHDSHRRTSGPPPSPSSRTRGRPTDTLVEQARDPLAAVDEPLDGAVFDGLA